MALTKMMYDGGGEDINQKGDELQQRRHWPCLACSGGQGGDAGAEKQKEQDKTDNVDKITNDMYDANDNDDSSSGDINDNDNTDSMETRLGVSMSMMMMNTAINCDGGTLSCR